VSLFRKPSFSKTTSLLIWPTQSTIDRVVIYDANSFARRKKKPPNNTIVKKKRTQPKDGRVKTAFHLYNVYACMRIPIRSEHKRLLQLYYVQTYTCIRACRHMMMAISVPTREYKSSKQNVCVCVCVCARAIHYCSTHLLRH